MSLNDTPSGERLHIGFFGIRNAGKSSLVNALTNQEVSVVSDVLGTTTDPVSKSMELLPLGPVVIIDTPGIDDEGTLGEKRVLRTKAVLNKCDIAIVVHDANKDYCDAEHDLLNVIKEKQLPYIIAHTKIDTLATIPNDDEHNVYVSSKTNYHLDELKAQIGKLQPSEEGKVRICTDLLSPNDFVVLVVPIDKAAPKGRLILPQQQTIRDILDANATAIVVQDTELKDTLPSLGKKPKLVITDSQVFKKVANDTPEDIQLTSFSILLARHKGFLDTAVEGVTALDTLQDGDTIMICEGCTHRRTCGDIGTEKLPKMIRQYTGKELNFEFTSGHGFADDLSKYKMIIHCGGCMLTDSEILYRMKCAVDQHVPFTNYGTTIAYTQGILRRSLEIFPHLDKYFEK